MEVTSVLANHQNNGRQRKEKPITIEKDTWSAFKKRREERRQLSTNDQIRRTRSIDDKEIERYKATHNSAIQRNGATNSLPPFIFSLSFSFFFSFLLLFLSIVPFFLSPFFSLSFSFCGYILRLALWRSGSLSPQTLHFRWRGSGSRSPEGREGRLWCGSARLRPAREWARLRWGRPSLLKWK